LPKNAEIRDEEGYLPLRSDAITPTQRVLARLSIGTSFDATAFLILYSDPYATDCHVSFFDWVGGCHIDPRPGDWGLGRIDCKRMFDFDPHFCVTHRRALKGI
jgi:hypothetical protein